MKKLIAFVTALAMVLGLVACGSAPAQEAPSTAPETKAAQPAEPAAEEPEAEAEEPAAEAEADPVTKGVWCASGIKMGEMELDASGIESMFGVKGSGVMTIAFRPSGTAYVNMMGESALSVWETTADGYALTLYGESEDLLKNDDGTLTLVQKGKETVDGVEKETETDYILAQQDQLPDGIEDDPMFSLDPYMTPEETCRMSTFMNSGIYYIEDDTLYGLTFANDVRELGARKFDPNEGSTWVAFEDEITILDQGYAKYLTREGDYLYYICEDDTGISLRRCKPDGSDKKVIYDNACDYLSIMGGRLFFTDENGHFVSTDPEGNNLATLLDKEVFFPYPICNGWFIFQDDANGECLTLYHLVSGMEYPLNDYRSYSPILSGHDLYFYTIASGEDSSDWSYMCKMDLLTQETQMSEVPCGIDIGIDTDSIFMNNGVQGPIEDWNKLTSDQCTVGTTEWYMYFDKDYYISFEYENDLVTGKHLFKKATGGGESFR